jgi:outer membrane protein OmpA-like peptidoglycan-associated protein
VVDYLIESGIDAEVLVAKGYGETVPAANCNCTKCSEEEHQENRRTTFKILSD